MSLRRHHSKVHTCCTVSAASVREAPERRRWAATNGQVRKSRCSKLACAASASESPTRLLSPRRTRLSSQNDCAVSSRTRPKRDDVLRIALSAGEIACDPNVHRAQSVTRSYPTEYLRCDEAVTRRDRKSTRLQFVTAAATDVYWNPAYSMQPMEIRNA